MNRMKPEKVLTIIKMFQEGRSYRFIQEKLKVSPNSIKNIVSEYLLTN